MEVFEKYSQRKGVQIMEKVNWGVLSTAEIARDLTIPGILRSTNAQLTSIASLSGKTNGIVDAYKIPKVYNQYENLLEDPDIDAVYIPLPNHMHSEWVIKAAEKGKHVLCEKPAALTVTETKRMVDACKQNGVIFMETFTYQYHPQNKRVKEIITDREIGDIKLIRSHCSFNLGEQKEGFRLSAETGGGSLYDVGCYCIHAIRTTSEKEPTQVLTKAEYNTKYEVDMSASSILEFPGGIVGMFNCGMNMAKHMAYEIVGTEGMIQVPKAFQPEPYERQGTIYVTKDNEENRVETIKGDECRLSIEHFSDCVLNGTTPLYDGDHTIKNMKVLEACLKSAELGKEIEVR